MAKRIVIVGGGDAAIRVLEYGLVRIEDRGDVDITVIKKESDGWISICGLPFALQGEFDIDRIEVRKPKFFIEERGYDFRTETDVKSINLENNSVTLGNREEIKYDHLVIATGAIPFVPPIEGRELKGVYTVRTKKDGEIIEEAMSQAKNGLVIGGGIIGLQMAVAFLKKGLKTTVVEALPSLLPAILDSDMGTIVQERLEKQGMRLILGKYVNSIKGDRDKKVKSVVVGEEEIPADIVIIATGVRPNVELAKNAGIEIGESGGIVTDCSLHTKKGKRYISNVYALGDCVEVIDFITHRPRLSQLASTAMVQSKVVADNIFGISSSFEPCLSPTIAVISGLQVGAVGITSETAARYGVKVIAGKASGVTRARYYPGTKPITEKFLFDAVSEKLVDAQIVSEESVPGRVNDLSMAIKRGATIKELSNTERCYDPSVAFSEDITIRTAEAAKRAHFNRRM